MKETSVEIQVQIQPKSSRDEIVGLHGGRLKIKITAPPADGKANERLAAFIAKSLGVPKTGVQIVRGKTSRLKTLRVSGIDEEGYNEFLSNFRER